MATSLLGARLPRLVVMKSTYYLTKGYAHRKEDGLVVLGEESALSTFAKIEAERAKVNPNYVHLRFCNSNKYWARKADNDRFIIAESNKPEDDTSKSSCTLFEAVMADEDKGFFYLTHVQSGGRLLIDETTMAFVVKEEFSPEQGKLSFLDWDTLVKLPKNVAFKGYNDSWLGGILSNKVNYLQYSVDDSNTPITTYKIQQLPNGQVRIYSNYFNKYCRRSSDYNWVVADSSDATGNDDDTVFWPVKINDTTIALRNAGNNKFCVGLDAEGKTRCLNASAPNITNRAQIVVQELVMARKVYNVRYRMEDSRIFDETPFLAGTTTVYNYGEREGSIAVELNYLDFKSQSFTRSVSLTAGVSTSFEAKVPFISKATITVGFTISTTLEWNDIVAKTVSVKATGTVPVPPRSKATVSYVGTMGTCDVPFTYTQQDTSATDGRIFVSDLIDGVFRGVNAYNFSFVVDKTEPLSEPLSDKSCNVL